jgi:hypothetical protein
MEPANDNGQRELGREQRELACRLTETELLARGETMAEAELEIGKLKEHRKGINGAIADYSATRNKLAKVIEDGEELRMVDCVWIEDIAHNVQNCIRQDTGAQVGQRAMTAADHQLGLELNAADADGADGDADALAADTYDDDTGEVLAPAEQVDVGEQRIELPPPKRRKSAVRSSSSAKATGKKAGKPKGKTANGKAARSTRHAHA